MSRSALPFLAESMVRSRSRLTIYRNASYRTTEPLATLDGAFSRKVGSVADSAAIGRRFRDAPAELSCCSLASVHYGFHISKELLMAPLMRMSIRTTLAA